MGYCLIATVTAQPYWLLLLNPTAETDYSRQFIGRLMNGQAGKFSQAWQRVLDTLGLEVVVQRKAE